MLIKRTLFIFALLFVGFGYAVRYNPIFATTCTPTGTSPSFTIVGPCSFATSQPGVDAGTGTTNTAVLNVTGGTLTIAASTTIYTGSIAIGASGIVSVVGTIKLGTPLYWTDTDGDHYAVDPATAPLTATGGTGLVRTSTLLSTTVFDCNDASASTYANKTCYADADNDTYTLASGTSQCSGSTCPAGYRDTASAITDCNDGATTGSQVYKSATCYDDKDLDSNTLTSADANATCINAATCETATKSSASTANAAVSTWTAGQLKTTASVHGDCCDSDAKAYYGETTPYTTPDACTTPAYDYNCDGSATLDTTGVFASSVAYSCTNPCNGCGTDYSFAAGWTTTMPSSCGATATQTIGNGSYTAGTCYGVVCSSQVAVTTPIPRGCY